VGTFQYVSGREASAKAVIADPAGQIYVAGYAADVSGVNHWIVRKN